MVEETPHAALWRDQLKDCVLKTATYATAVHDNYQGPAEGAKLAYESVKTLVKRCGAIVPGAEAQLLQARWFRIKKSQAFRGDLALDDLDQFIKSSSSGTLAVSGEAGSGKSSLLASWTERQEDKEGVLVVAHSAFMSGAARGTVNMLQNINAALAAVSGQPAPPLEVDVAGLASRFNTLLSFAAASQKGKIVVVVNGLDHLRGGPFEAWLPRILPVNAYMIVSVVEDTPLVKQGWQTLAMAPPSSDDRELIAKAHLMMSGKVSLRALHPPSPAMRNHWR